MLLNKFKTLFILLLFLSCSCHHFSGEVVLTDKEKRIFSSIHNGLKASCEIEFAGETDVLIYRNWKYKGFWNDLESWKQSQDLFVNICIDYWKIKPERITVIEQDRAGKLEHFLKNYEGRRLIIYFVSHQTAEGEIVLHDGSKYPQSRLASLLNSLQSKTLLIYDTCHAEILKESLESDKVAVYYGSKGDKEAYDIRVRGQKPSLTKMCSETRKFIKNAWSVDVKTVSVFGFFLVNAMMNDSYSGVPLKSIMTSIMSNNRKITKIVGLGRYPQVYWQDAGGWGDLILRK